jgi:hypothetical protein
MAQWLKTAIAQGERENTDRKVARPSSSLSTRSAGVDYSGWCEDGLHWAG